MSKYISFLSLLDFKEKQKFLLIIILFILLSFFEVIGIASVIPFITAIFYPENLEKIRFLQDYKIFIDENKEYVVSIFCLIFFIIFSIKNIFSIVAFRYAYKFNAGLKASIASKVLKKYFKQDYLYFVKNSHGKLSTILASETSAFSNIYLDAAMILISETIILIGIFILIILTGNLKIFFIIIPVIVLAGLIISNLKKHIKKWSKHRVEFAQDLSLLGQRIFLGIRDIYFSNKTDNLLVNFYNLNKKQSELEAKNSVVNLIPRAILELIGLSILLISIIFLLKSGISSEKFISTLTFYFVIAYRALPSYNKILVQSQRLKYSENSVQTLNSVLNLDDKRKLKFIKEQGIVFQNEIKYQNISFSYSDEKPFIKDANFYLKKGEVLGLFGSSGSGKSTILNIITLLIPPKTGEIFIDEKKLNSVDEKRNFQNLVTFISQDTFLIEDTIKENIILNSEDKFDQEKLNSSIKLAKAEEFINSLPNKLNYLVGSQSRRISSGQKQRIVLARAFYENKDIIVLDEATNAIDEYNESVIFKNIMSIKKNKTIIIVSHNRNNLLSCDRIYDIKNGKIKELK